jgi:hypothetical protein
MAFQQAVDKFGNKKDLASALAITPITATAGQTSFTLTFTPKGVVQMVRNGGNGGGGIIGYIPIF